MVIILDVGVWTNSTSMAQFKLIIRLENSIMNLRLWSKSKERTLY